MNKLFKVFAVAAIMNMSSGGANAAPVNEIQENNLEKLVAEQDACRLVIVNRGGMTKLYFANKKEAEAAIARLRSQSFNRKDARKWMPHLDIFSPDCDIDVLDHQRGN